MSRQIISFANAWKSFYICTTMDDTGTLDRQTRLNQKVAYPGTHTNYLLKF